MVTQRFLKYIVSERGRSTSLNAVCVASISMFTINYLPHTVGITQLREFLQLYSSGFESPVPDKIQRRFEQALIACECNDFERLFLKPFMAYGFDTLSIGSTKSRFGAFIGVPANYAYDTPATIDTGKIQLKGQSIAWSSEDGQRLREALVLTEDEQIFGVARSILQVKSHKLLLTSLYAPVSLFIVYALGSSINRRRNLYARPLGMRSVLYGILSMFGFGLYTFMTDFTEVWYDTSIDKQMCDVGPEFVEAGVRFYQKALQKNVAIRNLSNDTSYTVSGNEDFGVRQKSMPLTVRKSYFELRLSELQKSVGAPAVNAATKAAI